MRFGLDALLLACFAAREFSAQPHHGLKNRWRGTSLLPPGPGLAAVDLGCGQGASTAALLLRAEGVRALGVDAEPALVGAARENAALLHLTDRAAFLELELARAGSVFAKPCFDLAMANPPYWEEGQGRPSGESLNNKARRGSGSLSVFVRAAYTALVHHGLFYLIYPASRFAALADALSSGRFGMRKVLPVHARADRPALRVLVEAVKDSAHDIRFLPGLVLYEEGGRAAAEALSLCPWIQDGAGC